MTCFIILRGQARSVIPVTICIFRIKTLNIRLLRSRLQNVSGVIRLSVRVRKLNMVESRAF